MLLVLQREVDATSCPSTTATGETKPLYLLTLVLFPEGLNEYSGACIPRDEINKRTDILPGYHIELIVDQVESCSHLSTVRQVLD